MKYFSQLSAEVILNYIENQIKKWNGSDGMFELGVTLCVQHHIEYLEIAENCEKYKIKQDKKYFKIKTPTTII